MPEIRVRRLDPDDDRSAFRSANDDLDRHFHLYAGQNQFRHHVGVTYVAVRGSRIVGYVTIAAGSIDVEALPARRRRGLPSYPLPVLRLARMATDAKARGQGVGLLLLRFVLQMAKDASDRIGCIGVVVDAKPEAVSFYERYGFEAVPPRGVLEGDSPSRPAPALMFLPVGRIPGA